MCISEQMYFFIRNSLIRDMYWDIQMTKGWYIGRAPAEPNSVILIKFGSGAMQARRMKPIFQLCLATAALDRFCRALDIGVVLIQMSGCHRAELTW